MPSLIMAIIGIVALGMDAHYRYQLLCCITDPNKPVTSWIVARLLMLYIAFAGWMAWTQTEVMRDEMRRGEG